MRQWSRSGFRGRRSTDQEHLDAARLSSEKPMVLVVDNDLGVCLIQSMYLRALGCKVFTAHNGRGALENATALLPDVIVMGLEMPSLDGYEAIRRLSESNSTRRIPVVAVTADPNSRFKAFEAGCAAYLTKPCEPQIVWAQIRALLRLPETGPTPG